MESFSIVWSWIFCGLLAVALALIYQGIKENHKKQINKIEKDGGLYGMNLGDVKRNIHHFDKQSELPPLDEVFDCANKKIEILTWTAEDITTQHIDSIRNAVSRGIHVTIMLLAPDSDIAKKRTTEYSVIEMSQRIQKSLKILCDEKNKLGDKKHNLIIKKYYVDNNCSMILLDSMSNDAWIQSTQYVKGVDASSRYSDSAYKKENEEFFNRYYDKYLSILKNSEEHECSL